MDIIYNINEIKTTLIDFHNLTQFRIALFDKNFNELLSYPTRLSNYCKLIRSDLTLNQKCNRCDYRYFSKCRNIKEPVMYECHGGLIEFIIPIKSSNSIIGYMMSGQLRQADSSTTWKTLSTSLKDYNLDLSLLESYYNECPKLSNKIITSTMNILNICADYLPRCDKIRPEKNSLAYKIDSYISEHISEDIDIETLCQHFNYKKTTFYKVTNNLFGIPIMKYIRQVRIHEAKLLLSNTNLSISDISNSVGIYDYNYFTKIFKAEVKCTPREYRNNSFVSIRKEVDKI